MKNVYLILAVLGAVIPYVFFLQFFADAGFDAVGLLVAGFANGAAAGFSASTVARLGLERPVSRKLMWRCDMPVCVDSESWLMRR